MPMGRALSFKQCISWACVGTKETHLPKYRQPTVKHMLTSLPSFQKHSLRVSVCHASVQSVTFKIVKAATLH